GDLLVRAEDLGSALVENVHLGGNGVVQTGLPEELEVFSGSLLFEIKMSLYMILTFFICSLNFHFLIYKAKQWD
ncbi:hypothetical protein DKP78_20950, partial [Enterococcus faecium]